MNGQAFELRPYQREAVDAVQGAGVQRPLISLPTGTGKTVIFAHLISERPGRSLVLAHRDELIQQAADKLRSIIPDRWIGIVKADASVRSSAFPVSPELGPDVVDEAEPEHPERIRAER